MSFRRMLDSKAITLPAGQSNALIKRAFEITTYKPGVTAATKTAEVNPNIALVDGRFKASV
jgi:hypothetical protein